VHSCNREQLASPMLLPEEQQSAALVRELVRCRSVRGALESNIVMYMPGVEGNTLRCELGCRLCLKIGRQGGRRAEH